MDIRISQRLKSKSQAILSARSKAVNIIIFNHQINNFILSLFTSRLLLVYASIKTAYYHRPISLELPCRQREVVLTSYNIPFRYTDVGLYLLTLHYVPMVIYSYSKILVHPTRCASSTKNTGWPGNLTELWHYRNS